MSRTKSYDRYKQETNTFQAIVASSDSESYAIFTYQCGGMLWSSSDATIGFGDPYGHYRNHPYRWEGYVHVAAIKV